MKRLFGTLSVLMLALSMTAIGYSQGPAASCCQQKSACCEKPTCCQEDSSCCHKGGTCCHQQKPACCDGDKNAAKPAGDAARK